MHIRYVSEHLQPPNGIQKICFFSFSMHYFFTPNCLSHLSKNIEWLFAPFLFHYTLKECEQCQEEQFVQDHFILGIKSDLYLRHHTLFVKTNWLLSFGSDYGLLIFYESIKNKMVKKRQNLVILDKVGFNMLCTERE